MGSLANKRILLGVCGGIAAYKTPELVRRLRETGAEVRVILTAAGAEFVTPLSLQAVSGHAVYTQWSEHADGMDHIALARWADLILIAPATANTLAKLAHGLADDLLSTLCLATRAPIAVAPAMNQQMWQAAATQTNLATLMQRGLHVLGPGIGAQACGENGPGRMWEPPELVSASADIFANGLLDDLHVVVTAGPTYEALDPARGLTNRSSGKMGYALATAAQEAGARVNLISGPTQLADPDRVTTVRVRSADEMLQAVQATLGAADIFIGAAAVADYRPRAALPAKLKKSQENISLDLVKNPDILAHAAGRVRFAVGFAAETDDVVAHARAKLLQKNLDLIAANAIGDDSGFAVDTNRVVLIDRHGETELPLAHKSQLARTLIEHIARRFHEKHQTKNSRPPHRQ